MARWRVLRGYPDARVWQGALCGKCPRECICRGIGSWARAAELFFLRTRAITGSRLACFAVRASLSRMAACLVPWS